MYFAPYIDESGYHMPTYEDIRDDLIEQTKLIFGADIYLSEDSQDYEYISIFALKIFDTYKTAELIYNNRSPVSAVGSALDSVVKLNGIKRKSATHSKCLVKIEGEPETVIKNGVVSDIRKNKWNLENITITESGYIFAMATAQETGNIIANISDINKIETVTQGWNSVINEENAVVGVPIESDSQLRARQTISVAQPSKTILIGTIGAVASVKGIKRYKVYENDTNITDENTIPPHSICVVAEDGEDKDIAEAIYMHKTPGCGTYGEQSVEIFDDNNRLITNIKFCRPEYIEIKTKITIKALNNYTNDTLKDIKKALIDYCNNFSIGTNLNTSALWSVIFSSSDDLYNPKFSIFEVKVAKVDGVESTNDIKIEYNQVVKLDEKNIVVNIQN